MRYRWMLVSVVLAIGVGLSGCVSSAMHEQTAQDLQTAKSERERLQVLNEALSMQLKGLQESKAQANTEAAQANAALAKEREAAETTLKELERQVKDLTLAKKTLTRELEIEKQRNEDRLKTIKRQQKELKEREQAELLTPPAPSPESPVAPPLEKTPESQAGAATKAVPPPVAPKPVPEASRAPAASPGGTGLVNINTAMVTDLILIGLGREEAQKLVQNRPYKSKEEVVSKARLSPATLEKIQDKITVGP